MKRPIVQVIGKTLAIVVIGGLMYFGLTRAMSENDWRQVCTDMPHLCDKVSE